MGGCGGGCGMAGGRGGGRDGRAGRDEGGRRGGGERGVKGGTGRIASYPRIPSECSVRSRVQGMDDGEKVACAGRCTLCRGRSSPSQRRGSSTPPRRACKGRSVGLAGLEGKREIKLNYMKPGSCRLSPLFMDTWSLRSSCLHPSSLNSESERPPVPCAPSIVHLSIYHTKY